MIALVPDLGDYPKDHCYLLFAESDENTPPTLDQKVQDLSSSLGGLSIANMVEAVSKAISAYQDQHDGAESLGSNEYDDDIMMEYDNEDDLFFPASSASLHNSGTSKKQGLLESSLERRRILTDLRKVKDAGFKVGIHGVLSTGGYLCISIRISKLGISEEAMKAWGVGPNQYLVLLIHYRAGYIKTEDIGNFMHGSGLEYKVALSNRYKPRSDKVREHFTRITPKEDPILKEDFASGYGEVEEFFISKSLNELMNKRFETIVKIRHGTGYSWTDAEALSEESQGKRASHFAGRGQAFAKNDHPHGATLPPLVTQDHIQEGPAPLSLPLLAMQFTLRHFVRCTEFCLNCHCIIETSFEALKPYVCSRPLCLYQYMHLGFGPSIEWEIISQPYVVDLLVSFCWAAAFHYRLKGFPVGLGINVPCDAALARYASSRRSIAGTSMPQLPFPQTLTVPSPGGIGAQFNPESMILVFPRSPTGTSCPFSPGQWLMLRGACYVKHVRIKDVRCWPSVMLDSNIEVATPTPSQTFPSPTGSNADMQVECHPYDTPFDSLSDHWKQDAIIMLLETLPDVLAMKLYLEQNQGSINTDLSRWHERISPYAMDILRWIIASNRSCIIQVDNLDDTLPDAAKTGSLPRRGSTSHISEDRVPGMDKWIQFRFAQGAPDKEKRFIDSMKSTQQRLNLKHPTIFAWHGSPIQNWHGIVREGLHFKDKLHGRAFGNGIYLSQQYHTAAGYMDSLSRKQYPWPQSKLQVSSVITLNEVVNAPEEFVSKNPHLVVNNTDWVQTRFLFVHAEQTSKIPRTTAVGALERYLCQDPMRTVQGQDGPLVIPITAVAQSRRQDPLASGLCGQRAKPKAVKCESSKNAGEEFNKDNASICTTESDQAILDGLEESVDNFSHESIESIMSESPLAIESLVAEKPETPKDIMEFTPGRLDLSTLPLLAKPENGSVIATKALQHELRRTLLEQDVRPLHELGWHIDANIVTNMYQWIVEMHSFEKTLPLATDMMNAGLRSIIIEVRFTTNYPYSPPFIRVIRPRFLDFARGGGGHVTAGGAICMELLTNSGWNPASSIESVLLQVRMAITSTDPRPARLSNDKSRGDSYSVGEAIEAYKRACRVHGWQYPREFDTLASTAT
ncbi:putative ubiquitin conjugating enzyme [Phaeomoniella chlamydospora]|uniref:Putative ubiquitin conjugating enzyme n=1 Tax=Phaeomoniella chlamydospora TaxID=158046 RepID=A0A0G2EJ79_PHACM|nr:putative ubiquitin conjugating enzyme [Phaeomoniella chlamydospora]